MAPLKAGDKFPSDIKFEYVSLLIFYGLVLLSKSLLQQLSDMISLYACFLQELMKILLFKSKALGFRDRSRC